jgi:hypothetical protein
MPCGRKTSETCRTRVRNRVGYRFLVCRKGRIMLVMLPFVPECHTQTGEPS